MVSTSEADWAAHNGYAQLYRVDPRQPRKLGKGLLEKIVRPFTETDIQDKWGGCDFAPGIQGFYSTLLSWDGKIKYGWGSEAEFRIEGPPKYPTQSMVIDGSQSSARATSDHELLDYLKKRDERIDKLLDEREARTQAGAAGTGAQPVIDMVTKAYSTSLDTIIRREGGSAEPKGIEKTIMDAAVQRMLNPGDPFAPLTALGAMIPGEGSALEKVAKVITGGGGGGGEPSMGVALIQTLPALLQEGLKMWQQHLAMQREVALINARGVVNGRVTDQARRAAARPADRGTVHDPTMPANAAPGGREEAAAAGGPLPGAAEGDEPQDVLEPGLLPGEPSQVWIERRIVKLALAGADGEDIGLWLLTTDERIVQTLGKLTKEQLLTVFSNPDSALSMLADLPRLPEIIDQFLEFAKEQMPAGAAEKAAIQ
jgi:hypothetical protein